MDIKHFKNAPTLHVFLVTFPEKVFISQGILDTKHNSKSFLLWVIMNIIAIIA